MAKSQLSNFTPLVESRGMERTQTESGGRVYKGVTIIKAGLGNKRDKNYYPPDVLSEAVDAGLFDGLKAYADHPSSIDEEVQPERTVRDFVGLYNNARFVKEGSVGRVVADFRVLKSHKWLSDTIDDLIDMGAADKIGLSINGRGHTEPGKVQITEAGSTQEVEANVLKRFIDLRSADVVTEAGAGGGFADLLESARGTRQETPMAANPKALLAALSEAAEAGDLEQVKSLTQQLGECACAQAEADEVEEAEEPVEETEEPVEETEEPVEEADEDEADDEDGEDEVDEAADDAVEEAEVGTAVAKKAGKLPTKGQKFGESAKDARIAKLEARNERLAEALRVHQKANLVRKLLKESGIPSELRGGMVDRLMGLGDERAMRREIDFQSRLLESAKKAAREEFDFDVVEGAGSRIRESYAGPGDNLDEVFAEVGLPLKR